MHEMTPEDQATDYAAATSMQPARAAFASIDETIRAMLREAYLAGYAHARNESEREDWIDPTDEAATFAAAEANAFLLDDPDKYPNLRDKMREDTIDPTNRGEVLVALWDLVDRKEIDDADLADHIGDPSVCQIPDELRDVLATGFDLHGIDTLADLATELAWQLSLDGAA